MNEFLGIEVLRGNFKIETYSVSSDNNLLVATKSEKKEQKFTYIKDRRKQFLLKGYINSLYTSIVEKDKSNYTEEVNQIILDGDYLIVFENHHPTIVKKVFDLRGTELPEEMKKQIKEIQECLEKDRDKLLTGRYAPIIETIVDRRVTPLISTEETEELEEFYKSAADYAYKRKRNKHRRDYGFDLGLIFASYTHGWIRNSFPVVKELQDKHLVCGTLAESIYFLGVIYAFKILDDLIRKVNLNKDIEYYIDLCSKVENGDRKTIRSLAEYFGRSGITPCGLYTELEKNQFYLSLSRDLTILDCFDNEDLSQIKSELILLGYEYLHECPRADENEILEEMYMNKLKKIEEKIDLTDKELAENDEYIMDLITNNCDFDENGRLKLIPIVYDQTVKTKKYAI